MLSSFPALAGLAICGPALLAANISPSATFFNQAFAIVGWGSFLAAIVFSLRTEKASVPRQSVPVVVALGLTCVGVLLSQLLQRLPSSLALPALGFLVLAACGLVVAAMSATREAGRKAFEAMCLALVVAAVVNAVLAGVQVFAPDWAEGDWIARPGAQGRAGGNLRQPNHLSTLLLWAAAAVIWLYEQARARKVVWAKGVAIAALALMMSGVVLTASRTGFICIALLMLWGIVDRQLSRFSRLLLVVVVPLSFAIAWAGATEWSAHTGGSFVGNAQLHKADPSSSRLGIWANTLDLIRQNPWLGVGWGEFNFAWSLTPFPGRPVAFFDHTHNLPLNLLVELGLPLGTLVLLLLAWSLWKAFTACWRAPAAQLTMIRTAFVMVIMMVVHSMLEYPLWYVYFLLPTAFAFGVCLAHAAPVEAAPASTSPRRVQGVLLGASLLMVVGALLSVVDYMRVAAIFSSDEDVPLSQRIATGQKSWFFAHHADYAEATVVPRPSTAWRAFRRAPHYLLDTRLMIAWATAYAEKGDVERARYLVERLREFRNPDADEFFSACTKPRPDGVPPPFQCAPSTRRFTYEDFKLQ
jgi:O-antigen ligase